MGPFSNNTPPPPIAPNNGTKLPVPDVDGAPADVVVSTEPDNKLATKKWFIVTMITAGVMALIGLIVFLVFIFVSNTPGYILNAAMQNLVKSDGEAGAIRYETKQGGVPRLITGDFLAYTDPTNRAISTLTVSAGQSSTRTSSTARLFPDANYIQIAGLSNAGQLFGAPFTVDQATRLGSLDGQWYSFVPDDVFDARDVLPPQVQGGLTSGDIETIRAAYLKHPFVTAAEHTGDEQLSGINTMKLKLGIDQAIFAAFLGNIKSANIKALQLSDADLKTLQDTLLGLHDATVEAWIVRSDHTFQQIRIIKPAGTFTLTFHSEQVAAQRQSVLRPEGAKSATVLLHGIRNVLTPSATR